MTRPAGFTSRGLLWALLLGVGAALVIIFGAGSASASENSGPSETSGPVAELLSETVDPVAKPVTDALKPATDPLVKPVDETLKPVTAPVKKTVEPVTKPIAKTIEPVAAPIRKTLEPVAAPVGDLAIHTLKPVSDTVSDAALRPTLKAAAPVVEAAAPVVDEIVAAPASPTPGDTGSTLPPPAPDSTDAPAIAAETAPVDRTAKTPGVAVPAVAPAPDDTPTALPIGFGGGSIPSPWSTSPTPGSSSASTGGSMMQLPVAATPSSLTQQPAVLIGLSSPRDVVQKSQDASRPETSPG